MYENDIKNLQELKELIDVEYGKGKEILESIEKAIILMEKQENKQIDKK